MQPTNELHIGMVWAVGLFMPAADGGGALERLHHVSNQSVTVMHKIDELLSSMSFATA